MTKEVTKLLEDELYSIVNLRVKFMIRRWESVNIIIMKSYIEIMFSNSDSDFRATRFPPDIETVIKIQKEKLGKDIIAYCGKKNMDLIIEALS